MSHTPGPWKPSLFNIVTDVTGVIKEKRGDTKLQVNKGLLEILDDHESTVAFVNLEDVSLSEEDLANALLIAAAPEMLKCLQAIVARIQGVYDDPALIEWGGLHHDSDQDILKHAKKLITKATGEKS